MATLSMSQLRKLFPCLTSSSGNWVACLNILSKKIVLGSNMNFININEILSEILIFKVKTSDSKLNQLRHLKS